MNKAITLLCLIMLFLGGISCVSSPSDEKYNSIQAGDKIGEFKKWLVDTLSKLTTKGTLINEQIIKVSPDSLYIEISNSYNLTIDTGYNGENRELVYALDLLKRNNLRPGKPFRIDFVINNYYTKSMVKQLIYDYDSEIMKFIVFRNDSLLDLKFIKGNLIDRKLKTIGSLDSPEHSGQ